MNQKIQGHILGAKRYNIDGQKSASLYLMGDVLNGENEKGALPMKLPCDFDLLEMLDEKHLPGDYELEVKLSMGGGVKAAMHVVSVKPSRAPVQPAKA